MTVPYSINSSGEHYKTYYINQAGGSIPFFRGKTIQHGSGLSGMFSKVFKGIAPVLKQTAKHAGKQLLNTGVNIAKDMLDGRAFTESAKANFSKGGKDLFKSLSSKILPNVGGIKQTESKKVGGVKRKFQVKKKKLPKTKRRRLTSDIFK